MLEPLIISDTTLRDGHQQPGIAFTKQERIYIASMLQDLGVDVIEAGFPANPFDMEPVYDISKGIHRPKISALARMVKQDIDAAYEALKPAVDRGNSMVHVFIGTSDMLLENSVRKSQDEVDDLIGTHVSYAVSLFGDVQFSAEDATRTPEEYLHRIIATALQAGATRINIPDTVGYAQPLEYIKLIQAINEHHEAFRNRKAILSVHCHNDLDNAVTNTLSGIAGGARQFEGTINGLGERAGNTDIASVVMSLRTREDLYGQFSDVIGTSHIDTALLTFIATEVDRIAEMPTYNNRPVTGTNAFRDSSGIHGNAVRRNSGTYHIMHAEDVGSKVKLVIGPTSGTGIVDELLEKYGIEVGPEKLGELTEMLKGYSIDVKDALTENEALVAVKRYLGQVPAEDPIQLRRWEVNSGTMKLPYAGMELLVNGEECFNTSSGVGPIDAATKAILQSLNGDSDKIKLVKFEEVPSNSGSEALAHARIALEYEDHVYWGRAREPDIVNAGVNAMINALNAIYLLNPELLKRADEPLAQ